MDENLTWLAKEIIQHVILHWAEILVRLLFAAGGIVLGALVFGRRYKQRIADLETEVRRLGGSPSVVVNVGKDDPEIIARLMDHLDAKDSELLGIRQVAMKLPQTPISGANATYADLPNGTRIVTMVEGSIRIVLPVRLNVAFEAAGKGDPPEG